MLQTTRFLMSLVLVSLFGGCEPSLGPAITKRAAKILDRAGFNTLAGQVRWYPIEQNPEPWKYVGANPDAPYGYWDVPTPTALGASVNNPTPADEVMEELKLSFRLEEGEAVVFVGRTPPPCLYFGFHLYLNFRYSEELGYHRWFTNSLGEPLNHKEIATCGGSDPFDKNTIIIVTADQNLDKDIRSALAKAKVPLSWVNTYPIPKIVRMGLGPEADTLGVVLRVALSDSDEEARAYREETPAMVLRVTRKQIPSGYVVDRFPNPILTPKEDGHSERPLRPILTDLVASARQHYEALGYEADTRPFVPIQPDPIKWLEMSLPTYWDSQDARYASALANIDEVPGTLMIVFGVNHKEFGKAVYCNLSLYRAENLIGFLAVNSRDDMPGHLEDYLEGIRDPEKREIARRNLYAFRFARPNPAIDAYQVPYEFDPNPKDPTVTSVSALPYGEDMFVWERAYLNPRTNTGPAKSELLTPIMMIVRPKRTD